MRIYLDVCCLARPFDDQTQQRIRLESEAVLAILDSAVRGEHEWIAGEVVEEEISRDPNAERRAKVTGFLRFAHQRAVADPDAVARARSLCGEGLRAADALHLAVAESAGCDVLLTTDDDFVRRAGRLQSSSVRVLNPLKWFVETSTP